MTLKIKNNALISLAYGVIFLVLDNSAVLSRYEWTCYRHPVPGWTPCVCTHNPGEPLCFWSSEPTCSPCDPSTICHVACPGEMCNLHQGCAAWPKSTNKCSSSTTPSRSFDNLCHRLVSSWPQFWINREQNSKAYLSNFKNGLAYHIYTYLSKDLSGKWLIWAVVSLSPNFQFVLSRKRSNISLNTIRSTIALA